MLIKRIDRLFYFVKMESKGRNKNNLKTFMKLTNEQEKEMKRVFPNGYEESDIPAFIREREEKKEAQRLQAEELAKQEAHLEAQEIESQMREDNY